ncbi:MAG: DUF1549 domain-containing protein [Verrucomicrobiota bacterium]
MSALHRILLLLLFLLFSVSTGMADSAASKKIDKLVKAALKEQEITANKKVGDAVFLRRAYLDIAGRIPTIEEAEQFHQDSYPNKREQLIDQLLSSEAYVSNSYHFWADLLRINGQPGGTASAAYELWVKDAIRSNRPYDEMVNELVTATGKIWDNGAVGYYFRDRGMPLDNMSNTVRIFLGTRLECAQCHNHPFDKWTQMDYYKMAAFSFGMNTKNYYDNMSMARSHFRKAGSTSYQKVALDLAGTDNFPFLTNQSSIDKYKQRYPEVTDISAIKLPMPKRNKKRKNEPLTDEEKQWQQEQYQKAVYKAQSPHERLGLSLSEFLEIVEKANVAREATAEKNVHASKVIQELYDPLQYTNVSENEKSMPKLPHDYQYSDADPHDPVLPDTMFGSDIDLENIDSRIDAYGEWMTSPENPTFTKVIVNRLWKEAFGLGIFEPVDELTDHTFVSNPKLLSYLEDLMREYDYDVRRFLAVLYNTNTYQSASFSGEVVMGAPYYFQGPVLRRMSAEQIWDSLVALALPEADLYQPRLKGQVRGIAKLRGIFQSLEERSSEEFIAMVEELAPVIEENQKKEVEYRTLMNEARAADDNVKFNQLRREYSNVRRAVGKKISAVGYKYLEEKVEGDDLLLAMGLMDAGATMMMGEDEASDTVGVMTSLPKIQKPGLPEELQNLGKKERYKIKQWQAKENAAQKVYRELIAGMARASELQSPARRGHFLRDFGQSDREVIENAASDASVPQALNLLNGQMVDSLTNRYSTFGSRLYKAGTVEEKASMIFQAMLTREPSAEELALVKAEFEREGEAAYPGIVWALLNTQQFMFVQ